VKQIIAHPMRLLSGAFMLIAEPRVIRLLQFAVYVSMAGAGSFVLLAPPTSFQGVLGQALVVMFGSFVLVGSLLGMFAVLPGIWWLERVGLLALTTGLMIYCVLAIALGSSLVGTLVTLAFSFTFAQRWMEIRRFQLAPKRR
jgi:hypothetical protein